VTIKVIILYKSNIRNHEQCVLVLGNHNPNFQGYQISQAHPLKELQGTAKSAISNKHS